MANVTMTEEYEDFESKATVRIETLIKEENMSELEATAYVLSQKEIIERHRIHFGVKPKEIGMLGLCREEDYNLAYLKAIERNIPYNEKKYLINKGWSEEEIKTTNWG